MKDTNCSPVAKSASDSPSTMASSPVIRMTASSAANSNGARRSSWMNVRNFFPSSIQTSWTSPWKSWLVSPPAMRPRPDSTSATTSPGRKQLECSPQMVFTGLKLHDIGGLRPIMGNRLEHARIFVHHSPLIPHSARGGRRIIFNREAMSVPHQIGERINQHQHVFTRQRQRMVILAPLGHPGEQEITRRGSAHAQRFVMLSRDP